MNDRHDIFRKEYKPLSDEQKQVIADIKEKADVLLTAICTMNISVDPRSMALAKTNLEQAVMWAVKAIT